MRRSHRVFALLTLLGWLFATGHVVAFHGGAADDGAIHALAGHYDDHDDHDGDAPEHDGHHHDLTLVSSGQAAKTVELKTLAPVWLPIFDALAERLVAMMREAENGRGVAEIEMSPPDERSSGWLLVVQTALPVRGPSLI